MFVVLLYTLRRERLPLLIPFQKKVGGGGVWHKKKLNVDREMEVSWAEGGRGVDILCCDT